MVQSLLESVKQQAARIGLGLAVLVIFLVDVHEAIHFEFIDTLENISYDWRLVISMPNTKDERIVVIDLDEKSLAAEGQWPWPRDRVAILLRQLFEKYEVAVLGVDVFFPEADRNSGLDVLRELALTMLADNRDYQSTLATLEPELDNDGLFAEALSKYQVVLGFAFNSEDTRAGALPTPTLDSDAFRGRPVAFEVGSGYVGNLDRLQQNASGAGHLTPYLDADGIIRRVPMLYEFDGAYYEAFSLAVARAALNIDEIVPKYEPVPVGARRNYSGLEWLQIGRKLIPVDDGVRALVPYRGRQYSFPYVSAIDVINGDADPKQLRRRIALLGTTAAGLLDLRSTPVSEQYAGVEVHANMISGILDDSIKQNPPYVRGAEFVILLSQGLIMAVVLPLLSPLAATAVTLGLFTTAVGLNLLIWHYADLVLPIASGVLMIGLMFLLNMSYGYFIETRGKRQLTGLFGTYVPPELVDEMSRDPTHYSLEAENRELTVLFSDVRGFTTLSEGLDPKQLADLMNQFLTPMTYVIHDHRGTIDKYMGDAIMAFWGAPVPDPTHARDALVTGMAMVASLRTINRDFKARGWPAIRIGVGINTGNMSVGNMGSEFRMAYTVLGDAVNLGSRLEGLTKGYGVSIIVSETTRAAVPEFAYRELDRVRVKGKDEPVVIYEPLGDLAEIGKPIKDELKLYQQALKYYRGQEWDMAELQFLNLQKSSTSPYLYKMYAERVAQYRKEPPAPNWDGVYTFTTK